MLANLLRTDTDRHREIPADSARPLRCRYWPAPSRDATRERRRQTARLRAQLREFYPAALQAFTDRTTKTALAILAVAPIPGQALCLTHDGIRDLARGCGRWGISLREVTRIHDVLHQPQLRRAPVEQAMGTAVLHLTLGLRITNLTISRLAAALLSRLLSTTARRRRSPGVARKVALGVAHALAPVTCRGYRDAR